MNLSIPSPSRDYRELSRRLGQLHALIRAGEGDSDEAEAIRDEMDGYYWRLTPAEIERADLLSEDFNRLADILESEENRPTDASVRSRLIEVEQLADLRGLRELLDSHRMAISKVDALLFRSIYWAALEDFEAGLTFLNAVVTELERERVALDSEVVKIQRWFENLPDESIDASDQAEIQAKVAFVRELGMRLRQSVDVIRGRNEVLSSLIESLNSLETSHPQSKELTYAIKRAFIDACRASSGYVAA